MNPKAKADAMHRPARGYRRFSLFPAKSRNLLWKLNIIMQPIWGLGLRVSTDPCPTATFRRESAQVGPFMRRFCGLARKLTDLQLTPAGAIPRLSVMKAHVDHFRFLLLNRPYPRVV